MPHCIIEYSNGIEKYINPQLMIDAVYKGALTSELFEDEDIKTRAIAYDYYQTGALKKEFVHVTLKILTGRSLTQKIKLSELVINQLEKIDFQSTVITVDIVEMEKDTYSKINKITANNQREG